MAKQRFFRCSHCGNIIAFVKDMGPSVVCCGEKMQEIIPGTSDGAAEKHVPVIETDGDTVKVRIGEIAHPMTDEHYIEWISIETVEGNQRKELGPDSAPEAAFALVPGDSVVGAYAYCNLHGLWKSE